jgi:23S rRNA pseudouridine1911/1915/1917 synthase
LVETNLQRQHNDPRNINVLHKTHYSAPSSATDPEAEDEAGIEPGDDDGDPEGGDPGDPPVGEPERQLRQIPAELGGLRFDQALASMFPEHSRSRLQAWLRSGRVRLNDETAEAKRKVWGGERVSVAPEAPPSELAARAEAIELTIVHEDKHLLVVNKAAGMVVHPGSGNWRGTMLNALLHHAPALEAVPRAGIVHRLDKDTSGLLVVAKTLETQTDLVRQLAARTVKREYLALVHGFAPARGTVDAPVGRDPRERTRMAVVDRGRPARTHYHALRRFEAATLLECSLDTGRTHQIRVHMQSIGHPLVGDPVYGRRHCKDPALEKFARQALHAAKLGLIHPGSGKAREWAAPVPPDMAVLLESIV